MIRTFTWAVLFGTCLTSAGAEPVRLLIAFSSYRERPKHPQVYFYEHDGLATGKIVGSIPTITNRSDHHPALSADGRLCAFASEVENLTSRILLFNREENRLVELPLINDSPNAQLHPTLSADGGVVAFTAWNRPGVSQRWDLALFGVTEKKFLDVPALNQPAHDELMPAFSGDGRLLAFTTNGTAATATNICLYDRSTQQIDPLSTLNSPQRDLDPVLSVDGRLVAFSSDRPGGSGGRDIYLFDRTTNLLIPLPGLNSVAHEQTPAISPDGRFLLFVSERSSGSGERDLFLYDRRTAQLLPTPGLNARQEDIDPCIILLPAR